MEDMLVDALECSVCLNQLDSTARVLPCQHTFCLGCLNDINKSHKELRCPECRVLVTVPLKELPCNILLMRILEGIKNRPPPLSTATTTAPTTTDFSYILDLYNVPNSVTSVNSSLNSHGSNLGLNTNTSLSNHSGFSNQVLNAVECTANSSNFASSITSHGPTVDTLYMPTSHFSLPSVPPTQIGAKVFASDEISALFNPLTTTSSSVPCVNTLFSGSSANICADLPSRPASSNPFFEHTSIPLHASSSSLTSSPVPFMLTQDGFSPMLQQMSNLSLTPAQQSGVSGVKSNYPVLTHKPQIQQSFQTLPLSGRELSCTVSQITSQSIQPQPVSQYLQNSYITPSMNLDASNSSVSTFLPPYNTSLHAHSSSSTLLDDQLQAISSFHSSQAQISSSVTTINSTHNSSMCSFASNLFSSVSSVPNIDLPTANEMFQQTPILNATTQIASQNVSSASIDVHVISSAPNFVCSNTSLQSFPPASSCDANSILVLSCATSVASVAHSNSLVIPASVSSVSSLPVTSTITVSDRGSDCRYTAAFPVISSSSSNITNEASSTLFNTSSNYSAVTNLSDQATLATTVLSGPSSASATNVSKIPGNPEQTASPLYARALYNYNGSEPSDLVFEKGAMLQLVRVVDSQWYVCEYGSRRGFVPTSYVQLLPHPPRAIALYKFKMPPQQQRGSARHCLSFNKGDVLSVLRRIDLNWAEGSVGTRVGIFPVAFVQLNAAAAALLQSPVTATTAVTTTTSSTVTPVVTSMATPSILDMQVMGVGSRSDPPAVPASSDCLLNLNNSLVNSSACRHLDASAEEYPLPLTIPANTGLPAASKTTGNNMAMLYVARFSYTPQKGDEVALTKGGLYAVTQRCHDGWFKGRCLTTHCAGVFPGNYLAPARGQTIAEYLTRRNSVESSSASTSPQHGSSSTVASTGVSVGSNASHTSGSPAHCITRRSGSPSSHLLSCAPQHPVTVAPRYLPSGAAPTSCSPTPTPRSPASVSAEKGPAGVSVSPVVCGPVPAPLLRDRYRCTEAYPASSPRELSLLVGDVVYALQPPDAHAGDGWLYGLQHSTGQRGLFPVTFVEPL